MRCVPALLPCLALLAACGGGDPPPKTVADDDGRGRGHEGPPPLDVSAEIGALDEDKVTKVFGSTLGELERCLNSGAQRVEFIGGSVAFFIKVGQGGRLVHAHLEQSSLGDRATEKCMLDALRNKTWPAPVGGQTGLARKSFDFDPPNDVRPPTEWSRDRVEDVLSKQADAIDRCKAGSSGEYRATLYVDTKGRALGVGITPPDERGEGTVDCLVDVLKSATYPSPGSWPAKVSFTL